MTTREQALTYATERIKQKDSFLVIGMPGVGVSSYLRFLHQTLSSNPHHTIVLSDLNITRDLSENSFYQIIIDQFNEQTKEHINNVQELANYVKTQERQLVVIVDRFEKAVKILSEEFFDGLRSTIETSGKNVTFVCGLDQDLLDLRNYEDIDQFYTLVSSFNYYLRPLTREESDGVIEKLVLERNITFKEDTKETLFNLTGGHLRMLKSYLLTLDTQVKDTGEPDIAKASASDSVQFQCQRIFDHLSDDIRTSLLRVVGDMQLTMHDQANIKRLINRGILRKDSSVFSERFRDYLAEKITGSQTPLYLDTVTGEICKDGLRIDTQFSANEYKLLSYMIENEGRVISRDEIADAVWGVDPNMGVSDEAIDQLVSRIREKIEPDRSNPAHLITVRGRGFQLKTQ